MAEDIKPEEATTEATTDAPTPEPSPEPEPAYAMPPQAKAREPVAGTKAMQEPEQEPDPDGGGDA